MQFLKRYFKELSRPIEIHLQFFSPFFFASWNSILCRAHCKQPYSQALMGPPTLYKYRVHTGNQRECVWSRFNAEELETHILCPPTDLNNIIERSWNHCFRLVKNKFKPTVDQVNFGWRLNKQLFRSISGYVIDLTAILHNFYCTIKACSVLMPIISQ